MIEYIKTDIGFFISMFVIFISGIGIGAGLMDALNKWEGEEGKKNEKCDNSNT